MTDGYKAEQHAKGHLLRRPVTYNADEVIVLDGNGGLAVGTTDYREAVSVGSYWCSCGEEDMTADEAKTHLVEELEDGE